MAKRKVKKKKPKEINWTTVKLWLMAVANRKRTRNGSDTVATP